MEGKGERQRGEAAEVLICTSYLNFMIISVETDTISNTPDIMKTSSLCGIQNFT